MAAGNADLAESLLSNLTDSKIRIHRAQTISVPAARPPTALSPPKQPALPDFSKLDDVQRLAIMTAVKNGMSNAEAERLIASFIQVETRDSDDILDAEAVGDVKRLTGSLDDYGRQESGEDRQTDESETNTSDETERKDTLEVPAVAPRDRPPSTNPFDEDFDEKECSPTNPFASAISA
eukprot:m.58586 g.58586  ORF g.58586 m.58586 type:complete len:179 (+) comp7154_c0_seq2:1729-2265(+)